MKVIFYQNKSDDRKVDKSITLKKTITGVVIKEDTSIIRPVLEMHYYSEIMTCNYLLIEDWGRYYYIDNITLAAGQRLIIQCREDVLMTNQSNIYGTTAFVERSEKENACMYINDNLFLSQNRPIVYYTLFDTDLKFNTRNGDFSLAIAGG